MVICWDAHRHRVNFFSYLRADTQLPPFPDPGKTSSLISYHHRLDPRPETRTELVSRCRDSLDADSRDPVSEMGGIAEIVYMRCVGALRLKNRRKGG